MAENERIKEIKPGDAINDHRWFGAVARHLNAGRAPRKAEQIAPPLRNIYSVSQFIVMEVFGDYLRCRTWDGTNLGTVDVNVAKPWELRQTPFDDQTRNGITYTYTDGTEREADDGSNTQDEVIIPSYQVRVTDGWPGDVIKAETGIFGGTGAVDADGEVIEWEDKNKAGRAWGKKST